MTSTEWNGAAVRTWLESRIVASRSDQAVAQRGGRGEQDDCDKATAEELVCSHFRRSTATDTQQAFVDALKSLLDRDEYLGRGVYDDTRFDRHVRTYIRKVARMAKANDGFLTITHYQ